MHDKLYLVDAFTSRPFAGNPAAVCLLSEPASPAWMLAIAAEMKHSETAFLTPTQQGFDLRWFTPLKEVRLCGHATLASAHALWESGRLEHGQPACFDTLSGRLTAIQCGDWIEMDFPVRPQQPASLPEGLVGVLGAAPRYTGSNGQTYLLELESEQAVRGLQPDLRRLLELPVKAVIVTAPCASPAYDFVSRFFYPAGGIPEDPVTGTAHCYLAPYWAGRLGKSEMLAYQVSARGGEVRLRLAGERVILGGQAVTVMEGQLNLNKTV
jgi:predicted PhzF superfamily epimerase YddE/YHI9